MNCQYCNGTGKITLLYSEINCECIANETTEQIIAHLTENLANIVEKISPLINTQSVYLKNSYFNLIDNINTVITKFKNQEIISLYELQNGELGYEQPPSEIPYVLRINDRFIYLSDSKDPYLKYINDFGNINISKLGDWPPDFNSHFEFEYSKQIKIITKNIEKYDQLIEAIHLHEKNETSQNSI